METKFGGIKMKILCVEDGSIDIDKIESEGLQNGKVLVYRQGAKPPFVIEIDDKQIKRHLLHIGKVADEPDEWVLGELVESKNPQYPYIFQKQEFPWSKCCGVGTFAVEKDSIKEVII